MDGIETTHRWQAPQARRADPSTFEQGDGSEPRTLLSARWPGEKGVHVSHHRFAAGAHVNAVPSDHLVIVQPRPVRLMKCRIGDERLDHAALPWNVTVCPASAPCEGECDDDVDMIIVSIPTDTFAFASLDRSRGSASPATRLNARDATLVRMVRAIAARAAEGADALWWDQTTDFLVEHMLESHAGALDGAARARLRPRQVAAVRDFVNDNIEGTISVDQMAASIGLTRSHFTRAFTKAARLTPHQFVMRTRLRHAHGLLRGGGHSAAEAALAAGFVDQSHLANWTRRVFGTSLGRLVA